MAFRIHQSVVRGEIDNRIKGRVRGRIWLCDRAEPLTLELRGNAHPDLAGCLLTFENRLPPSPHHHLADLSSVQRGNIGDLTASRKVRVFDIPLQDALAMIRRGEKPPEHMANCLYLEWFSESNGRVVVESTDYTLSISPPEWRLTPEEDEQRAKDAASGFGSFMQKLGEAIEQARFDAPEDRAMNEFEWEQAFRESDARTDKAREIFEKHGDDPDLRNILAREMGWDDAVSGMDDGEDVPEDEEEMDRICAEAMGDLPEPNPLTEGVDWVRDEDGQPTHPLLVRIQTLWEPLWQWCDERRLLEDHGNRALDEMFSKLQSCGAKCAGALGGLAYAGDLREPGFIVAGLKRALVPLHESLEATGGVQAAGVLPLEKLEAFRKGIFGVREEILSLMERFRGELE